jgi:acyl-CoA oxidase
MATDQVPPTSTDPLDEMPTVEPEAATAHIDDADVPADKGYRQPEVDVDALRTLLDGRYGEVRDLVRANLAEHAQILLDEEQMTTADFRERVKDVVVMMAGTGQTGMGFPEQYGGGTAGRDGVSRARLLCEWLLALGA